MEPIICPKCNVVCNLKKDGFYCHLDNNCDIRILDSGKSFVIFIGDEYAINNYGCLSDLIACEVISSFEKELKTLTEAYELFLKFKDNVEFI